MSPFSAQGICVVRTKGKLEDPLKDIYGQFLLRGEKFKAKIRGLLRRQPISHEIVERKRFKGSPDPEDWVEVTASVFGVKRR